MKRWILLLAAGLAIAVTPVQAHHSIASAYDASKTTTLEGFITEFHFVFPHPFVTIRVHRSGGTEPWLLEMDNRSELAQIGVTDQTFKAGDKIIVTGNPARGGGQSLYVRKLERPADGFRYEQVGGTPRIRTAR